MRQWVNTDISGAFHTAQVISHASFSPYELVCYRALYGLTANDLKKFQAGTGDKAGGLYFEAYQQMRQGYLENDSNCTHHLDRNWHLPAYLPDLNDDFAYINEEDRKTAFLYPESVKIHQ